MTTLISLKITNFYTIQCILYQTAKIIATNYYDTNFRNYFLKLRFPKFDCRNVFILLIFVDSPHSKYSTLNCFRTINVQLDTVLYCEDVCVFSYTYLNPE
jgi:hypothetical protein